MVDSIYPSGASVSIILDAIEAAAKSVVGRDAYFPSADCDNWAKEGVVLVSGVALCTEAVGTITLSATTLEYTAPTDWVKIYAAAYYNGTRYLGLKIIEPYQVGHDVNAETSADPESVYHFANLIGVDPLPGTAQATKTIKLWGFKLTDDASLIPDQCQTFLIDYVISRMLHKLGEHGPAAALYNQVLNSMVIYRDNILARLKNLISDYRINE